MSLLRWAAAPWRAHPQRLPVLAPGFLPRNSFSGKEAGTWGDYSAGVGHTARWGQARDLPAWGILSPGPVFSPGHSALLPVQPTEQCLLHNIYSADLSFPTCETHPCLVSWGGCNKWPHTGWTKSIRNVSSQQS